jgi:hypothetical protein
MRAQQRLRLRLHSARAQTVPSLTVNTPPRSTVKRAGHEVPMYQPERARAMLERFIAGAPL